MSEATPDTTPQLNMARGLLESRLDAIRQALTAYTEHERAQEAAKDPETAAVKAYRAFSSFLLGHLLLEVSQKGVKISPEDKPEGAPAAAAATDLTEYPTVVRLESLLSLDESAAEFEEALENLLERLEVVLREGRSPRRGDART